MAISKNILEHLASLPYPRDPAGSLVFDTRDSLIKISNGDGSFKPVSTNTARPWSREEKLGVRLDIGQGDEFPWPFKIFSGPNKVHLVIGMDSGDRILVLEDDPNLFPSDTLIAKLRMLQR